MGDRRAVVPVVAGHTTIIYSRAAVAPTTNGAIGAEPPPLPGLVWFSLTWTTIGLPLALAIVFGIMQLFVR
ncbi:hypothetical protein [Nocardia lijiangensis]|uniref:hypothetical protein n=1 Tax=Nocardia lijiangensis TaxID=299618 RepID=UPI000832630A|nr:hypothetical protein [Nocardia lijiangensis]